MGARLDIVTEGNGHVTPSSAVSAGDAPPGSMLARLRERAAGQRSDRTLDVAIWEGVLIARYRMPPMEDTDRLMAAQARLVGAGDEHASWGTAAVDLMATCCTTLLGQRETGELEDLEVRYSGRLLSLVGLTAPGLDDPQDATASEVIRELFGGNWMAVNVHAAQILGWLQEGGAGLGEASTAP